jgi:hypothetical protein
LLAGLGGEGASHTLQSFVLLSRPALGISDTEKLVIYWLPGLSIDVLCVLSEQRVLKVSCILVKKYGTNCSL